MASTWIHEWSPGSADSIAAGATEYEPLVGGGVGGYGTEAYAQILIRDTYTGSNLYARSPTNASDGTTTIRTRKDAGNGAQSVSFAAAETGTKEDTVNTDAMATGENWNYSTANAGATGVFSLRLLSVLLQHSGTGTFILAVGSSESGLAQVENILNYERLSGNLATQATETAAQYTMRVASTFRNLRVYVISNSIGASTVVRTRKNAGNGAQVATITTEGTGSFEDTTNSDTVTAAEEWNYLIDTTSAKMGTMRTSLVQIEASAVGKPLIKGNSDSSGVDSYLVAEGGGRSTTEADVQLKARVALSISNMCVNVSANTATVADVYFRKNGANAGPTVSYGSGVTGILEDTVNTTTLVTTDLINYFADLTSGSAITFEIIGVESQQVASGAITAALTGTGSLTAVGAVISPIVAGLTGAGSLLGLVAIQIPIISALTGAGSLTAVVASGGAEQSITAALSGTGALAATGQVQSPVVSALTGTGSELAALNASIPVVAALSGTGAETSVLTINTPITSAQSGTGALLASAIIAIPIISALSGTGAASAIAEISHAIVSALTGTGDLLGAVAIQVPILAALTGTGSLTTEVTLIAASKDVGGGGSDRWVWEGLRRPKPRVKLGGAIHIRIPVNIRAAQPEVLIPVSGSTGITFESWLTSNALVILNMRKSRLVFPTIIEELRETRTLLLPTPIAYTQVSAGTYADLLAQNRALSQELMREREAMAQELLVAKADTEALAILMLSEGL